MKIYIKCKNIAPLRNLDETIDNKSFNLGILARNGSGKTFISRLFRLLEMHSITDISTINRLITIDQSNAQFIFGVSEKNGRVIENITIDISKDSIPTIPNHYYIYHTFNQDYVDENIRALGYEHESDVQGYILGKTNIDISEDKSKLESIEKARTQLYEDIVLKINSYIEKHISSIRDIRRLGEYSQYISAEVFINNGIDKSVALPKTINDYIADYDKVKAVPEGLADIQEITLVSLENKIYEEVVDILFKEYSLSHFAEEFKIDVRGKQKLIEEGLAILEDNREKCPFCGQVLGFNALLLIDQYNKFLTDEESRIIKRIQTLIELIKDQQNGLKRIHMVSTVVATKYNEYKTKYIPSCEGNNINLIDIVNVVTLLDVLINALYEKQQNINSIVSIDNNLVSQIEGQIESINANITYDNELIRDINKRKNAIGEESKNIRRNICKAAYNYWVEKYEVEQKKYIKLGEEADGVRKEIEKKQEAEKVAKKKLVAETIKKVLDYFFSGKYTLDEDSFRLVFQSNKLANGQTKDVLSEGEKNIVAFAYYLGDTHTLIDKEEEYNKLIFIVDDPISSMDFTYVYTLSDVIRDMDILFPQISMHMRKLILTHNNDFIRILSSNNILDRVMYLRNGKLLECRDNHTVPYISHLLDVYRVARCGEKATHTTANSIRHIIETINRFEVINTSKDSVKDFIKVRFPHDKRFYTYINDLSHGGWRTDQEPMTEEDYRDVCEAIIVMIENCYPKQIEYCKDI